MKKGVELRFKPKICRHTCEIWETYLETGTWPVELVLTELPGDRGEEWAAGETTLTGRERGLILQGTTIGVTSSIERLWLWAGTGGFCVAMLVREWRLEAPVSTLNKPGLLTVGGILSTGWLGAAALAVVTIKLGLALKPSKKKFLQP